jgi:hypothetical protein
VTQIFISHDTNSDAAFANRLASNLSDLNVDVWISPSSIRPGEQWVDAIGRGLESSTHFALVSTPRAYHSSWIRKEYNAALLLEADGNIEVLPLEFEKTKIPLFLRGFQLIYFGDSYEAGLRQLANVLGVKEQFNRLRIEKQEAFEEDIFISPLEETKAIEPPVGPRVFVAHAWPDRHYADQLRMYLESYGLKEWMAPIDIIPGARWE